MRVNQIIIAETPSGVSGQIRAYHGTRHAFARFLMKAVGTGEGAQVFGYGLYFAENFDVAKFYADKLGEPVQPEDQHAGIVYEVAINLNPAMLIDWDAKLPDQSDYVRRALGKHLYRDEPMIDGGRFYDSLPPEVSRMMKIVAMRLYQENNGDLDALEGALGARVANATPQAKADVTAIMSRLRGAQMSTGPMIKPGNGGHLVDEFNRLHATPKLASRTLRTLGIQGIRYLDEGSRELLGHATSNFVIFNARYVKITRTIKISQASND